MEWGRIVPGAQTERRGGGDLLGGKYLSATSVQEAGISRRASVGFLLWFLYRNTGLLLQKFLRLAAQQL